MNLLTQLFLLPNYNFLWVWVSALCLTSLHWDVYRLSSVVLGASLSSFRASAYLCNALDMGNTAGNGWEVGWVGNGSLGVISGWLNPLYSCTDKLNCWDSVKFSSFSLLAVPSASYYSVPFPLYYEDTLADLPFLSSWSFFAHSV